MSRFPQDLFASAQLRRRLRVAALLLGSSLLAGCQLGYVLRQGTRQLGIAWGADRLEEIDEEEGRLSDAGRRKLALIGEVKRYAEAELEFEVGDAYTTYYETGDAPVSYVVTAAHPLALVPYQWRFPFVGRVAYKGFFDKEDALAEEARLREEGWDTNLGAVAAFSTLGWFKDPVLSSMLDYADGDLVELILHELVHRTKYFATGTDVNESMATAIARAATRRFLAARFRGEPDTIAEYERGLADSALATEIAERLRNDLEALYRSSLSAEEKRARKQELFATSERLLGHGGAQDASAEPHPARRPSNARVLARGQYDDLVPLFERAIASFGGDPAALMSFLKAIPDDEDPVPRILRRLSAPCHKF